MMSRDQIDEIVCKIMFNDGPDRHVDGHELITDFIACLLDGDEKGKDFVNHIDGNKHNNTVENLEWVTQEYNHEHAVKTGLTAKGESVGSSKLTNNMVHAIKWFIGKGISHSELSQAFRVSRPTISLIKEGKTWKHVTLSDK